MEKSGVEFTHDQRLILISDGQVNGKLDKNVDGDFDEGNEKFNEVNNQFPVDAEVRKERNVRRAACHENTELRDYKWR